MATTQRIKRPRLIQYTVVIRDTIEKKTVLLNSQKLLSTIIYSDFEKQIQKKKKIRKKFKEKQYTVNV